MNMLLNQMNELQKKDRVEDNLFVKNIIVNKDKIKKKKFPYVPTDSWVGQLGERLVIN